MFTTVECGIYLWLSWMKGKCAGAYTSHCTTALELYGKEKFFLALSSRRNSSSRSLYNKHEVMRERHLQGRLYHREATVFRGTALCVCGIGVCTCSCASVVCECVPVRVRVWCVGVYLFVCEWGAWVCTCSCASGVCVMYVHVHV